MWNLNKTLWVAQGVLATMFTTTGLIKLIMPYQTMVTAQAWVHLFTPETVKLIGAVELLGATGVLLPALTRIVPVLTPLAAVGLTVTMLVAGSTHLYIGEAPVANIILGGLAAFVAWGRYVKVPITAQRQSRPAAA